MDQNLGTLESRAKSGIARYGKVAAIVIGVAVVAGASVLVYRRVRRPSRNERLQRMLMEALRNMPGTLRDAADSVREMPGEIKEKLKHMPSVKVVVNGSDEREPGTIESIARKVAPAVLGTASTAVIGRLTRTPDPVHARSRTTPAQHD